MVGTTFTTTSSSFFFFFNTNTNTNNNKSSSFSIDFLFPTGKISSGTHLCFLSMMYSILSVSTVLVVLLKLKQVWTVFWLKRGGITTVIVRKRRRLNGWVLSAQTEKKVHLLDRIERWLRESDERSHKIDDDGNGGDDDTNNNQKRIFGATSSLVTGSCPFAHVGSSDAARKILKEGGTEKMPAYSAFKRFAGNGLFTCANAEEWRRKRVEVLKAFGRVGVGKLRRVAEKRVKELVKEIREEIKTKKKKKGGENNNKNDIKVATVTLLPLLQRVALRITFEYLCGISMEEACKRRSAKKLNDDDEKDSRRRKTELMIRRNVSRNNSDEEKDWKAIETEYLECSTILRRIIPARARSMWIISDFLYYTFSSVGREEKRAIEKAKLLAEIAVETCTENSALREITRGEAHGKRATDAVEEATTLLFAGHDTQSATMCWGILELVKHEKIQEELRRSLRKQRQTETEENGGRQQHRNSTSNEEDENENDGNENDDVNDDDADEKEITTSASKPELEAVIRETLRLHPVAPLVVRQMKHRSIHLENGVTIPKGTAACVWLHASHRDPVAWESPNAFQPSRWHDTIAPATTTTTTIKLKKPGKNFQPFASGQRSCVGQHVAMATLRVVFGQLLETFTFSENASEYPIADEMVPSVGFTVAPRFGARVNVSEEEED